MNTDADNPQPVKAEPPMHTVEQGGATNLIELPPYSLTVVRGAGPKLAQR